MNPKPKTTAVTINNATHARLKKCARDYNIKIATIVDASIDRWLALSPREKIESLIPDELETPSVA